MLVVQVQGGETEVGGAFFCPGPELGWDDVLSGPGEDGRVGWAGCVGVVFGGDVEGEVEKGGGAGEDVGCEAGRNWG